MLKKVYPVIISMLVLLCGCETNGPKSKYTNTYEEVWTCIDRNYVFFELMPCDWDELHQSYLAKTASVESDTEFAEMLTEMLTQTEDPMIRVWYYSTGARCPNIFYAKDKAHRLWPQSQESYRIIDEPNTIGSVTVSFGRIVRVDSNEVVTHVYDAVSFNDSEIDDYMGVMGQMFQQYLQAYADNGLANGLIVDLRSCQWMDIPFMTKVLECLYPKDVSYTLTLKHRSPAIFRHDVFVPTENMTITGKGFYDSKPIAVLINRATIMTPHVLATVLGELPNAVVIGREPDNGRGGAWNFHKMETADNDRNGIYYPGVLLQDDTHDTFIYPLKPDIYVDWNPDYTTGGGLRPYDKCIDTALDYIDQHTFE